ncbi:spore protease YyaC [Domibacillus aminovorans]|uniref:Sporulation protein n=2 Tax=Bacillales TaxID=1385 RepID=A0A177L304_9BACI|nr:sporulation protein [Domibacillus aminovorans]
MRQFADERLFVYHMKNELKRIIADKQEVIFVCIGSDRSSGDSYGPFVGSKLKENSFIRKYTHVSVYGCLDHPVHAKNLAETVQRIQQNHRDTTVIAIDACLGSSNYIGTIQLKKGPMKPGSGVQKDLPPIGDYSISGIVNAGGFLPLQVLQCTRLSLVYKMANKTADFIVRALFELEYEKKKIQAV